MAALGGKANFKQMVSRGIVRFACWRRRFHLEAFNDYDENRWEREDYFMALIINTQLKHYT